MRRIALTVAALSLFAIPAYAQTTSPSPSKAPTAADRPGTSSELKASDLKGMTVFSSDGQEIGEVAEVREGAAGQDKVHIKVGQDLGIGERTIEVQKSKLQKGANRLNLQMTASEVKQLPDASSMSPGGSSGSSGSSGGRM